LETEEEGRQLPLAKVMVTRLSGYKPTEITANMKDVQTTPWLDYSVISLPANPLNRLP